MNRLLVAACCLFPLCVLAQESGTVTLLEGPLRLIRGSAVYVASEGVQLRDGDVIETSDGGYAQIEWADADVAAVAGRSRLYLRQSAAPAAARATLILLDGWLKLQPPTASSGANDKARAVQIQRDVWVLTRGLGVVVRNARAVTHVSATGTEALIESGGTAQMVEIHGDGGSGEFIVVQEGQQGERAAGKPLAIHPRPSADFVKNVPRPFKDALPSRLKRYAGKPVEPVREHDAAYAEVEDLLTLPLRWRNGMTARFKPRLRDADFRRPLAHNLKQHAEWTAILYPPQPKNRAPLISGAPASRTTPAAAPDDAREGDAK